MMGRGKGCGTAIKSFAPFDETKDATMRVSKVHVMSSHPTEADERQARGGYSLGRRPRNCTGSIGDEVWRRRVRAIMNGTAAERDAQWRSEVRWVAHVVRQPERETERRLWLRREDGGFRIARLVA